MENKLVVTRAQPWWWTEGEYGFEKATRRNTQVSILTVALVYKVIKLYEI